ncbi:MAG: sigma-70 family RNA polymerase sigma factor, partial [Ilumatobacteraceae bacterium]|nr:sigma-70 family RNA polymerase sigma factor [Ilumatobacteraceae bacterium]
MYCQLLQTAPGVGRRGLSHERAESVRQRRARASPRHGAKRCPGRERGSWSKMVEHSEHSAIVEGLRSGTNEGLAAFYDLYADKLYDFARRQLRDASLAADVVHDTVLIVRSRIGQLRDESKFRAWVYAIVRNEVRAKARARSRHVREEYAPEQSVDPDFAGDHDRRELASLIDEAVAGLTEREQEVFHLFARQGLSNDEIAASLELSFA